MKSITLSKALLALFLFVESTRCIGQTAPDALAYFPVGVDALYGFIKKELIYPNAERKKGISGTVYVQFTIDSLGGTCNHKIQRGVSPGLDEEALRVTRLIKGFVPAIAAGKPVSSDFVLPIKFVTEAAPRKSGKSKNKRKN